MNRKILLFTATFILILSGLFLFGCQASNNSNTANQQHGLWVTGEGKVEVEPDVANIQLGIEAQSETVAEAQ